MSTIIAKLPVTDLPKGYYLFGNKGSVWGDTAHASKGNEPTTLCGVPMLSTNWARIEEVTHIGCPDCLTILSSI